VQVQPAMTVAGMIVAALTVIVMRMA